MLKVKSYGQSAASVAALCAALCWAESSPVLAQGNSSTEPEQVEVAATRIVAPGYQAPTPVTSISDKDLEDRGDANIADLLNQLPEFAPSTTPTSTALNNISMGQNQADLRGLGPNRTLVLIDGHRHVPTNATGTLDLNVIPQALIKRVDAVTGGASAAWGSDAVAGVVDIILDNDFTGLSADGRYGISSRGDGEDKSLRVKAGGSFGDGKGHIVIGGDWEQSLGVPSLSDRPWSSNITQAVGNPAKVSANDGLPATITANHATLIVGSAGGNAFDGATAFGQPKINDPAGLLNVKFGVGGAVTPFNSGIQDGLYAVGGDGGNVGQFTALAVPYQRANLMQSSKYDITPDITVQSELSFARTAATSPFVSAFSLVSGGPMLITTANPFLPASVKANMLALGVTTLPVYRSNEDIPPVTQSNTTNVWRAEFGFNGKIFSSWNWNAYYQYGRSDQTYNDYNDPIPANFAKAAAAVVSPTTGLPVCASALNGTDTSCVPFNPFGIGAPSAAAISYVEGTKLQNATNTQSVFAGSLSGILFSLPAGPVYATIGAERRAENYKTYGDKLSTTNQFGLDDFTPLSGAFHVTDEYAEVAMPLLGESAYTKSLEINGAARVTEHSSFGDTVSWKLGTRWEISDGYILRGSHSVDNRAPNISELFSAGGSSFATVNDPARGGVSTLVVAPVGGNPSLQPENATTDTLGAIITPSWLLSGLSLTADWYDVNLQNVISSLSAQQLVNSCVNLNQANACSRITRNSSGVLTQVNSSLVNLGYFDGRGVDFEARYHPDLDVIGGTVTFRTFGSWAYRRAISTDGVNFIDRAGEVGGQTSEFSGPRLRLTNGINYDLDDFGAFVAVRYVGGGKYIANETVNTFDNLYPQGRAYIDISSHYDFKAIDSNMQLYAGINNLFDNDPPIIADPRPGFVPTNAQYYDVVGRYFYAGIRAQF